MSYLSFLTDPVYRPSAWSENVMRIIEEAEFGGGDVFECVRTLQKIRPGNREDWYTEWSSIAKSSEDAANEALAKGNRVTARKAYLRAFSYYRNSQYYLRLSDKRKVEYFRKGIEAFRKAAGMFNPPFEYLTVDYENSTLEGILYHANTGGKTPLVVMVLGGDATKEEYYFFGVPDAMERGMSVLVIDGPGQASSLFLKGIKGTPEYEKPVMKFLDLMVTRDDIDSEKIAMVGRSFAGYLAPRVAAFDKRIKALVVWGAFYDLYDNLSKRKEAIGIFKDFMGITDDEELMNEAKKYTLKGVVGKISCPMLVMHGEADPQVPVSDAIKTYDEATCPKEIRIFKLSEPGSGHCTHDNPTIAYPMVYDWLMSKLK